MTRKPNRIAYPLFELQKRSIRACFNMAAAVTTMQAATLDIFSPFTLMPAATLAMAKTFYASSEMLKRVAVDYPKPSFGLYDTVIDNKLVAVTEEVVLKKDFGSLLHFKRDTMQNDPKVLIVSAMSGHYATIFRDTVVALLPHHDVYIVDWENARDVPVSKGNFGLDDYVSYVQEFIKAVGPETNVIGVSQSTVPVLAAVALMAAENSKDQPLSMTLMCGPVDTRAAETAFLRIARHTPLKWFADNMIATVPKGYKGEGRAVYPGFMQLMALMSTKPVGHTKAQLELFSHLSCGNEPKAEEIKKFYDEYQSVCDATDKFYLDTLERIFMKHEIATGTMVVDGKKVEPDKIKKTALLTVEGSADSLTAPGQTVAAHPLCKGLTADQHSHHLQKGADHYGLISGKIWQEDILPRVAGFIRETAKQQGFTYDPIPHMIVPERWTPAKTSKPLGPKPYKG
jgi:poly(3-hydroxybutyrate) depolymerase